MLTKSLALLAFAFSLAPPVSAAEGTTRPASRSPLQRIGEDEARKMPRLRDRWFAISVLNPKTGDFQTLDNAVMEKLDAAAHPLDFTKEVDGARFVDQAVAILGEERAAWGIMLSDATGQPVYRWPTLQPSPATTAAAAGQGEMFSFDPFGRDKGKTPDGMQVLFAQREGTLTAYATGFMLDSPELPVTGAPIELQFSGVAPQTKIWVSVNGRPSWKDGGQPRAGDVVGTLQLNEAERKSKTFRLTIWVGESAAPAGGVQRLSVRSKSVAASRP